METIRSLNAPWSPNTNASAYNKPQPPLFRSHLGLPFKCVGYIVPILLMCDIHLLMWNKLLRLGEEENTYATMNLHHI
jgi:hypothetical protein